MPVLGDGQVTLTSEGFLENPADWDERIAAELAGRSGIALTEAHWEIIRFMRGYYLTYRHLPNARMFVKAVQKALGNEKGTSRYLYRLFPDGPLKLSCLIAGVPKPPSCI